MGRFFRDGQQTMIYVQMGGRLGNQLFSYAAARALQLNHYPEEDLVFDFNYLSREGKQEDGWVNGLEDYRVTDYRLYEKDGVMLNAGSLKQKVVCALYYSGLRKYDRYHMTEEYEYEKRWSRRLNHAGVYWYRTGYVELTKSNAKNKLMSGRFEDPRYFESIRDILKREFTPKFPEVKENENLYKIIDKTESVCISVRRGDFESNPTYKKLHSVCSERYFQKAIDEIRSRIGNPTYFLFSDDVEWARTHIQIQDAHVYSERGCDPVWEKLRLMSRCKHFIISNSSFSWWAQWLSGNKDKVVVAPSRWLNNTFEYPLITNEMIKVQV